MGSKTVKLDPGDLHTFPQTPQIKRNVDFYLIYKSTLKYQRSSHTGKLQRSKAGEQSQVKTNPLDSAQN